MGKSIMKKYILLLCMAVIPLTAEEIFSFVGVNTAYKDFRLSETYQKADTSEMTFGFTLGMQALRWRTDVSLEHGSNYTSFGFNADYILLDSMFGTPKVRPYLGINTGYMTYDDSRLKDTDGLFFGGNAGLILYANDMVDIDIGYRYDKISQLDGFDTMQSVTLSVHYFY